MVRAGVAFACGLPAVDGFSSNRTAVTPRRPSSIASMSPNGPPPTMITSLSRGPMQARWTSGNPAPDLLGARLHRVLDGRVGVKLDIVQLAASALDAPD